jgi:hypothetical protein
VRSGALDQQPGNDVLLVVDQVGEGHLFVAGTGATRTGCTMPGTAAVPGR